MSDEAWDDSNCPTVEGPDGLPFCKLAVRAAVSRLSMNNSARAHAQAALEELDDPDIGDEFMKSRLKIIIKELDDDSETGHLGVVSYDDLLLALVEELDGLITTDARSLLETAQRAAHTLSGGGWIVCQAGYMS